MERSQHVAGGGRAALMAVIETRRAGGVNPFDFLLAVVWNSDGVQALPRELEVVERPCGKISR